AMSTVPMARDFWHALTEGTASCANTSRAIEKNLRTLCPLWLIPFFSLGLILGYVTHAWESRNSFRLHDGADDRFGNRFGGKHADGCEVCIRCRCAGSQCKKRIAV